MRHRSLWIYPLVSLIVIFIGLTMLLDFEQPSAPPPTSQVSLPEAAPAQTEQTVELSQGSKEEPIPTTPPPDFSEDWEGGRQLVRGIDVTVWKAYGDPKPLVKHGLGRNGSAAFDPNGDRNYESGIVSRFALKLEPGLAIEFWAKGRTNLEHWEAVSVGISRAQRDEYEGIEGQPSMLIRIYIAPATEAETVSYWLGQEKWEESFTPLNGSWHHYRMEIEADGIVRFYRDGELKFTPKQRIDFETYQQYPLVIEGRSESTDMLIDDLRVYSTLEQQPQQSLPSAAQAFVAGHIIGSELGAIAQIAAADLDSDGDPDLIAATNNGLDSHIISFENPGRLTAFPWPAKTIGKSSAQVTQIAVADFDNDGDPDVISGSAFEEDFELIAWENDGTPFDTIWRANNVGTISRYVTALVPADMDQDGDVDLIFGGENLEPFQLILWENNGAPFSGLWPRHDLATTDDTVYDLRVADLDGDGQLDIATGSRRGEDYEVIVWQNVGTPLDGPWQPTNVGTTQGDVGTLAVADLDEDGYPELISSGGYHELHELFVWHNDGTPFDDLWQGQMLGPLPSSENGLAVMDYDQDGVIELVSGSQYARGGYELHLWERAANDLQASWTAQPLGDTEDATSWIEPVDLDGDGDLDLVTVGNKLVVVWENGIRE